MHMYCLFCQTQKTEQIVKFIERMQNAAFQVRCISPKIVQRCWVQGREEHRIHNYLPGYLFLYTDEPIVEFAQMKRITGVVRILGLREDNFELTGSDRAFASMLQRLDGTIGIMKTIQIGDRVQLDSSLYEGFTGEVMKLDRRKGRAQIRFEFDGSTQNVWVGYDMVRTDQPEHDASNTEPHQAQETTS